MADETITELLRAASSGDEMAFRRLYERSYGELRRLAGAVRRGRSGDTLNTTALVHEAYLKLAPSDGLAAQDRVHFFRIASRAMRQVLIDAARRKGTRQRGLAALHADQTATGGLGVVSTDVLALDAGLRELEIVSPRQASVVECRFFAGLSVEETAMALQVSTPTVKRDWRVARAFLASTLGPSPRPAHG